MFCLSKRPMISRELSNYLRDSTNKSIDKHFKPPYISHLLINKNIEPKDISLWLLPFVSIVSFLAGYNFCKLKMITW
jgi:hypothetical protein